MKFDDFIKVIDVPSQPMDIDHIDWVSLETKLGVKLPTEYKQFIEKFGTVNFGPSDYYDFITILNPFCQNTYINIDVMLHYEEAYRLLKKEFPADFPRPHFPQSGSSLAWAITNDGDYFIWDIYGHPDEWKVGIFDRGMQKEVLFELETLEFLKQMAFGKIETGVFHKDFDIAQKAFTALVPK